MYLDASDHVAVAVSVGGTSGGFIDPPPSPLPAFLKDSVPCFTLQNQCSSAKDGQGPAVFPLSSKENALKILLNFLLGDFRF